MARPNLIICSVTCSAQSNYRNYATPKVRRSSHSCNLVMFMLNLMLVKKGWPDRCQLEK
jgi:hypothetical protein